MEEFRYLKDVATLRLDDNKCTGCGLCLDVCPHEVIVKNNGKVAIREKDLCMECGACALNCPFEAITVEAGVGCATAIIYTVFNRKKTGGQISCCG